MNKKTKGGLAFILIIFISTISYYVLFMNKTEKPEDGYPIITGEYLGQIPSGDDPEVFAPGIVCTGMFERDVAISPDGTEILWTVFHRSFAKIMWTRMVGGTWTKPEIAPCSIGTKYMDFEPSFSAEGNKFFFLSERPVDPAEEKEEEIGRWIRQDIWCMDRQEDGTWSVAYNLGEPINTDRNEYFASVTRDGTIYFTRSEPDSRDTYLFRSKYVDGAYQEPEKLGPEVNASNSQFNAYVAPDESYIITNIAGLETNHQRNDYYISFRNDDDTWVGPINLGEKVNGSGRSQFSPFVSFDGEYFFFSASRTEHADGYYSDRLTYDSLMQMHLSPENGTSDIYWMKADFLETLRPE